MKKISKNHITIQVTIIAIFCLSVLLVTRKTIANEPTPGIENGVAALQNQLGNGSEVLNRELLVNFCKASKATLNGFSDGNLLYTPNYSLFLGVLCTPLNVEIFLVDVESKKLGDKYLGDEIKKNWDSLGVDPESCDPNTGMRECDIPRLIKTIFSAVMNDHSLLGIGGWAMSAEKIDDLIKGYSEKYFGGADTICDGKSFYLNQKSTAGAEACSHPKTYKYLYDIIDGFQTQKKAFKTINEDGLKEIDKDAKSCEKESNTFANLFLCSYTSRPLENKQALQTNLWYNELMYYRLLSKWLIMRYETDTVGLGTVNLVDANNEISKNVSYLHKDKILFLENEMEKSKLALTIMQKAVVNFQTTFPLHVGLLAYYEDIIGIKKSFVKIYTPLHQLYYTLRNVQSK